MAKVVKWVLFCKRTEDPKLAYIERQLTAAGIPHRRNGASWHAPILEVPEADELRAWAILRRRIDVSRTGRKYTRELDEIADDHPIFREG